MHYSRCCACSGGAAGPADRRRSTAAAPGIIRPLHLPQTVKIVIPGFAFLARKPGYAEQVRLLIATSAGARENPAKPAIISSRDPDRGRRRPQPPGGRRRTAAPGVLAGKKPPAAMAPLAVKSFSTSQPRAHR